MRWGELPGAVGGGVGGAGLGEDRKEMPAQKRTRPDGELPKWLLVEDTRVGQGSKACRGDIVNVRYRIALSRGEVIAEGEQRGMVIGARRFFDGFERGIEGMQAGGQRRLRVPPHLAYRDGRLLICEIELLSIGRSS